ncbi:branched-chain amino acid ABC transporter permease [Allopusillimonas soli]|uniref:AzlC family ABC transporter permease n=1 Tax=Allopusillimonas soli TaxID=659016 RepID=A0A853FA22_9BURK|nr:AzlC family ABC transporter permease [Allopusillimonas soli]NYT36628.1 AzlC family ABC transporter permease [Allopusillimonas soli]TEA75114.1 branched-chain amino acid ABC transporter permease [Allopusillimonas soli]
MTRAFLRGLRDSLSIAIGYVPVAISFGLAAIYAGMTPGMAVMTSMLVFAGASQFILASLLAGGGAAASVIGVVLLMNLRHLFYGPAVLTHLGNGQRRLPLPLLAAGLTDEVFATAIARMGRQPAAQREFWYAGLQLGAYLAWVLGTAMGAWFGGDWLQASPLLAQTLAFVLPALFLALLLEMRHLVPSRVLVAAALASALGLCIMPSHAAMMAGMAAGALMALRK